MIVEGIAIAIIFFMYGYLTDYIDHLIDELKKSPGLILQSAFLILTAITSLIGYFYFPSVFLGVVIGLLISGKVDHFIYVIALLFFLPYVFLNLDIRIISLFALASFLDEKPFFSNKRPLLKLMSLAYGLLYAPLVLVAFGSYDMGYEYSNYKIKGH